MPCCNCIFNYNALHCCCSFPDRLRPKFGHLADSQGRLQMSSQAQTASSAEEISVHSSESLMRLMAGKYTVGAALGTLDLRSCDLISGDLVHLQDVWPADMQELNLVSA